MGSGRPGHIVPACFALLLASGVAMPGAVAAQSAVPGGQAVAVPDQLSLTKLLWSTMAAVDHANKTGNYSVLRDLGSPSFQSGNSAATLAEVFSPFRAKRIDLADTLVVEPVWELNPAIIPGGMLRLRGRFPLRPTAIAFDLIYEWRNGWALQAVSLMPMPIVPPKR